MYEIGMVYLFGVEDEMYKSEIGVKEVEIVVAYGASAKAALLLITANCLCDPSSPRTCMNQLLSPQKWISLTDEAIFIG